MGAAKKYPGNGCGVRDGLSGDMLALSQCNLVLSFFLPYCVISIHSYTSVSKLHLHNV